MSGIGPLKDEPPEPLSREEYLRIRKRLKTPFGDFITYERRDAEKLFAEIEWLKARLRRVEEVLEPIVEDICERRAE